MNDLSQECYRTAIRRPTCGSAAPALLVLMSVSAMSVAEKPRLPERLGTVRMAGLPEFDSDSVVNNAPNQWRWLSLPESRLVLNPSASDDFAPLPVRPDLPLNAGYYAGRRPHRLLGLVTVGLDPATTGIPVASLPASVPPWTLHSRPGDDFTATDNPWQAEGAALASDQGLGRVTVTDPDHPWGAAVLRVRPAFRGQAGFVRVEIPKTDGAWALKINTGGDDTVIQGDTSQTGTFIYRLDDLSGWKDQDQFDLKLFAIGRGKSVWVDSIQLNILAAPDRVVADTVVHSWYPYRLAFEARYDAIGEVLSGCDFFADEHTVVRLIRSDNQQPGGQRVMIGGGPDPLLQLKGLLYGKVLGSSQALLVEHPDFYYAVAVGTVSEDARVSGVLQVVPQIQNDQWHVRAPLADAQALCVVISFATRAEGSEAALRRVMRVTSEAGPLRKLRERKARWDDHLRRVPAPEQFGIEAVDPRGVTPEEHRRFYYGAWVFVLSNTLPPMPENDYAFPQSPCGKPSLWNFGASKAPASAAWESFFGQQMLAYVMPDTAWAAFEGIMAQVDETGWLDGECLPSRKAQTAWILYSLTGDTGRLRAVYPAIRRYLLWREKNPRWIYLEHDNPDEKDASFVDQLLVDVDFASRIADELGEKADVEMWRQRRAAILKNYREWFFFTDGRPPAEYYFTESKRHEPGNVNWVVTGLHIRDLPDDLATQLKDLYRKRHHPDHDLCGMGWTKYGTESFTAYGLVEQGMLTEARGFINAHLRDTIRAGEFSENYAANRDGPPRAWGVRPSLFGAVQMIDFTCMNNGVRLDQGRPAELTWPSAGATRPAEPDKKGK